mgnify:CR=1 FL=1
MVKINLGSGFVGLDGWLNYDNSVVARLSKVPGLIPLCVKIGILPAGYLSIRWPPIILHDCRKGIPLDSDSVDYVYSSHFMEHLYRHEVFALLKECHRVLKPSGRIRVVLPDLDSLIALYQKRDLTAFSETPPSDTVKPTYADMFVANFFPFEMNTAEKPSLRQRSQELFLRRHKWMYNEESFGNMLTNTGFKAVKRKAFRDSEQEDVRRIDAHEEVSFYLEAEPDK